MFVTRYEPGVPDPRQPLQVFLPLEDQTTPGSGYRRPLRPGLRRHQEGELTRSFITCVS